MHRARRAAAPSGRLRLTGWLVTALVLLTAVSSLVPVVSPTPVKAATHIKMPFAAGSAWTISQGYNTNPVEGGSHYNCDPNTLKDTISQTRSCTRGWQYKYSFDLVKSSGATEGQKVLSSVTGTITWTDSYYGGMAIDMGNGYAFAYFHTVLAPGLAAGMQVTQGQYLGTVAPPGQSGNGGFPHIHATLWKTNDGGAYNRVATPFTGTYALDGYDLPAMSESTKNQHRGKTIYSTNSDAGGGGSVPSRPVQVSPATGTTGTSATPTLRWNPVTGASSYEVRIDGGAYSSGVITGTSWTTPPLPAGRHTWNVRARNTAGAGTWSATWSFSVAATITSDYLDNGSKIGTGRYRVIGTREGGYSDGPLGPNGSPGTTSNGHRIEYNDHFVSLPACVVGDNRAGNCPGLTPGQISNQTGYGYNGWYVSNCGANCYVKVINPATNKCSVAPVYDRGPWFTIDNWWDTNSIRNINTNPNNDNKLAQGYGAARAARDGYDLGFGRTNGIGNTNVRDSSGNYRVTGQGNSVDIADGTWLDIGFPWNPGPQTVILEMLWQTGQSQSSAQAECSNTLPASISISPSSGPAGTTVSVSGSNFAPGETVKVYLDTASSTPIGQVTASSAGTFNTSVEVPATYGGAHRIHAVGQTSKKRNAQTFTVTPTSSLSPSSGSAGILITVTVSGFAPNETAALRWPGRSTPSATAKVDSMGRATFKVRTPRRYGPQAATITGESSGLKTTSTFTVVQRVRVTPTQGQSSQSILAYAKGWPSNTTVTFRWNSTSGQVLCSVAIDNNGYGECRFTPPSSAQVGTYRIYGANGSLTASTTYTITGVNQEQAPTETPTAEPGTPEPIDGTVTPVVTETPIETPTETPIPNASPVAVAGDDQTVTDADGTGEETVQLTGSGSSDPEGGALSFQWTEGETVLSTEPDPVLSLPVGAHQILLSVTDDAGNVTTDEVMVTVEPQPDPVEIELTVTPSADTSVAWARPEEPQSPDMAGVLTFGGEEIQLAYLTFDVQDIEAGRVVEATLYLTGAGEGGPGGPVGAIPGYTFDEAGLTYVTAQTQDVPAAGTRDGQIATVPPLAPGEIVAVDVSATVQADGTVTFVLFGDQAALTSVSSREGSAPPVLVIRKVE